MREWIYTPSQYSAIRLSTNDIRSIDYINTMTNKDIIQSVSQKSALTKQATERLLRSTVQIITETLNDGGDIKLQHFGSLEVRSHQARSIVNPRNGQKTEIPAKDVWTFKANTRLKEAVNGN